MSIIIRPKNTRNLSHDLFLYKQKGFDWRYNSILDKLIPLYIISCVNKDKNHYLREVFSLIESGFKDLMIKTKRIQLFKTPYFS